MRELKYTYGGKTYSYILKGTNEDINDSTPKLLVSKDGETKHLNLVRDGDPDADGNLKVTYNNVAYRIKKWPHILAMTYEKTSKITWAGDWYPKNTGESQRYKLKLTGNLANMGNPYNKNLNATCTSYSGYTKNGKFPTMIFKPGDYYSNDEFYGQQGTHWWNDSSVGGGRDVYMNFQYALDVDGIVCIGNNVFVGHSAE